MPSKRVRRVKVHENRWFVLVGLKPLMLSLAGALTHNAAMSIVQEAQTLSHYLIGADAAPEEAERFANAHEVLAIALTEREQRLFSLAMEHPVLLGPIDGALALVNPTSAIRRKIFMMLAILEASPWHCDAFLDRAWGGAGWLYLAWVCLCAGLKPLVGLPILACYGMIRSR